MNVREWPALAKVSSFPVSFRWERAIHGKPLGFNRDFGFVGSSKGFQGDRKEIENRFKIATQKQGGFALWWPSGNRFYATWCYVSRFPDESGRTGLETQVLEWERVPGVPAVLAAFAMLSRVASLTGDDWIEGVRNPGFASIGFELPLDRLAQVIDEVQFKSLISEGIEQFNGCCQQSDIEAFYGGLLTQRNEEMRQPVFLGGFGQPMPPKALASLLLPLDAAQAESCSVAGWEVENPDWNIIVSQAIERNRHVSLPASETDRPTLMAESIRTGNPKLTGGPDPEIKKLLAFARNPLQRTPNEELLPRTPQPVSDAERFLIRQAAEKIVQDAEDIPPYLLEADPKVRDAFTTQLRLKADYVIAWALLLHNFAASEEQLTRPGNSIIAIMQHWSHRLPAAQALERLFQASPSMRSSNA